jgi:hypothetical protein
MPELTKEIESRMTVTAETCIEHIKYLKMKRDSGEELSTDELGILPLENMFLVLYGLHVKGEIPEFALKYFEKELTH